jgi:hypothetical protein
MIDRIEIDGRPASAMYVDEHMQPTTQEKATFYKVVFDDGDQLILDARPEKKETGK